MGFDKTKVLRAAEKYLAQGKFPAAVKEYRQIIEQDPDDFTALNMLGDLYVRTGKNQEAIACFERIAEHYRERGFALKAIAMYKKIDRLNPGTPEIAGKLASLYEIQGLIVDARAQYLVLVDAYSKAGQAEKALEVLKRVADLDPNNTKLRLRLADCYLNARLPVEAAEAFARAGEQFLARGDFEHALEAYGKTLNFNPQDRAALNGLVAAHVRRGTADEAAEILEDALAARPDDVDLLTMLVRTYLESEDAAAAERTAAALVGQQAANYTYFIDVVRLYLKQGDTESAVRVLAGITEQMLAGREENELTELVNEILVRDPEQVVALRLLVRVYWWQRDMEKLRATLERLAEAAEAANLIEEARSALAQLAQLVPDYPRYEERLRALGGSAEGPASPAQPVSEPVYEEVPTFESFSLVKDEEDLAEPPAHVEAQQVPVFEHNSVDSSSYDAGVSFADLNDWTDAGGSASASASGGNPSMTGFQEFDFSTPAAETPTDLSGFDQSGPSAEPVPERASNWVQELESVDFYISQGYMDLALDTLEMLERQFGLSEEIETRRRQVRESAPPVSVEEEPAPAEAVEFSGFIAFDLPPEPVEENSNLDIDDAFAQLGAAASETNAPILSETPTPAPALKEEPGIDAGLAAIFEEFRAAAEEEEPAVSDNDYETHYNLGLAYKDMDLLDEAIEEFQIAARLAGPGDGTPRYLQCCNLLGHCFMQKGMPRPAVMWFKNGLQSPGHTQDEYQALRYELGIAYESMGDLESAIDVFTEVYGVSVSYRGVSEKLRSLQAQRALTGQGEG